MYTSTRSKETQSSVITCPVCGSDTVKRTGRYGSFWAAAGILTAAGLSRSRSITLDSPAVTAGLRSSVRPTPSRRSPAVVTSRGGSNAQAAKRSTWWKQPDGSLTRPALLNPLQPRPFRPIGSPETRPSCPGNSRTASAVNQFGGSAFSACVSDPHLLSKTDPGGL